MLRPISSLPEPPGYAELMAVACDRGAPFTLHVLACLFAIALQERAEDGTRLDEALGLGRDELHTLARRLPEPSLIAAVAESAAVLAVDEEEEQVRELLLSHRADDRHETRALCAMIARRAMRPNHLWQDLGLPHRGDLNHLLAETVPALHARNTADMKWKKFFYRALCELEGFVLCTAPSCRECNDFDRCFGPEDGETLLARHRRAAEAVSHL